MRPSLQKKRLNSPQHFYSNAALDNCEWAIWTCKVMLHCDALLSGKVFNIFCEFVNELVGIGSSSLLCVVSLPIQAGSSSVIGVRL